ncbi:MAG: glycosyltransferase [Spirochaetes bacterium]|nr:glycosyltransferase [Spirochaetota bacterium]
MSGKRIVIVAPGSRGDVQPYVALGKGLQDAGMPVRVVTSHDHEELVTSHGLEYRPVEAGIEDFIRTRKMREALEKGSLLTSMARLAQEVKRGGEQLARRTLTACEGMDMLLAGISGVFVARSISEKTGLPLVQAYNVPFTPTCEFPGALLPGFGPFFGGALNRLSHRLTRQIVWQAYRPVDRLVRRKVLGVPAAPPLGPFGPDAGQGMPVLYGISPSVIAPPRDWDGDRIHVTGYWFLEPAESWQPPDPLVRFLEAGSPPVYVGFGSMSSRNPGETAGIVLEALRRVGQRAVVLSGWGGLHAADLPDSVLMVDGVPHSWLFPRMAAVVHHGGAGTTAAGLRAGIPSVVVPFHGDQPFWGQRVAALGAGPVPIPRRNLTIEGLARAINAAVTDTAMRRRAADLGARISAEDGVARAVSLIRWAADQLPAR